MAVDPNKPVSPFITWHHPEGVKVGSANTGMTLREHFAGLAMQGISSHPDTWGQDCEGIARFAVKCADALIAELAKGCEA